MLVHKIYNLLAETVGGKQLGSIVLMSSRMCIFQAFTHKLLTYSGRSSQLQQIMLKRSVSNNQTELLSTAS
jgi:hypothetical protein